MTVQNSDQEFRSSTLSWMKQM